jgi:hypothetical protein
VSAALGVVRWTNDLKNLYRVGLIMNTLTAGFAIGYTILRLLKFPSTPWRTSLDHSRRLIVNWLMFIVLLIGLPVACTILPLILGRSGQFNNSYRDWNNACLDGQYTAMLHIRYISVIGSPYSINIYARDSLGVYHYLGLLPSSPSFLENVDFSTPNSILYPTTNQITSDAAAGQHMFSLFPNSSDSALIASLRLNVSETGDQSILATCVNPTSQNSNPPACVNGFLTSGTGGSANNRTNPLLATATGRTKTFEIMYDIISEGSTLENSTFLTGYTGSWPSSETVFMSSSGETSDEAPYGVLEEYNSDGDILAAEGVQVISAPWPGCDGLKVCGTTGLNALIAAGWIWENLGQWKWYSPEDCLL